MTAEFEMDRLILEFDRTLSVSSHLNSGVVDTTDLAPSPDSEINVAQYVKDSDSFGNKCKTVAVVQRS